jgi:hypothetical protein
MASETNQSGLEGEVTINNHGNGYPSAESAVEPSGDEIKVILSNYSHETHIQSNPKKVREKICLSIDVDGDI